MHNYYHNFRSTHELLEPFGKGWMDGLIDWMEDQGCTMEEFARDNEGKVPSGRTLRRWIAGEVRPRTASMKDFTDALSRRWPPPHPLRQSAWPLDGPVTVKDMRVALALGGPRDAT